MAERATKASKRNPMLAKVHVLAKQAGLDEDAYRDFLERETGKRSASALSDVQLAHVCERLSRRPEAGAAAASGPYAPKLKALWLSAYHLGLAKSDSDAAMMAFVKRQTGIDSTRFLIHARDANKAIEGLKAWIERHGVHWWKWPDQPRRAVVEAQVAKLDELGNIRGCSRDFLEDYVCRVTGKLRGLQFCTDADWDFAIRALGARLRRALAMHAAKNGEGAPKAD